MQVVVAFFPGDSQRPTGVSAGAKAGRREARWAVAAIRPGAAVGSLLPPGPAR